MLQTNMAILVCPGWVLISVDSKILALEFFLRKWAQMLKKKKNYMHANTHCDNLKYIFHRGHLSFEVFNHSLMKFTKWLWRLYDNIQMAIIHCWVVMCVAHVHLKSHNRNGFLLLAFWGSIKYGHDGNYRTFFIHTWVKPTLFKLVHWVFKNLNAEF